MRFPVVSLTLLVLACFAFTLPAVADSATVEPNCDVELPATSEAPMSVDLPEAPEIDLGQEKQWKENCWIESRWVDSGCCNSARPYSTIFLKQQDRTCCEFTGCGGWQYTGATNCTGSPCPF